MGILPEKPAFPAVVDCPFCQQPQLYLFDDVVTDGIWAHCESCRAHGDIITFASLIWNNSRAEALARLVDLGAASQGEADRLSGEYFRAIRRLEATEAFWEQASSQVWNHHDDVIACRQRELGLERTIDACSGVVGVAHPDQVAEFCRAVGRAVPPRMREHGPSLVLPYYDLPGRFTGVLLIQYNDEFMSRRAFIALQGCPKRRADAGYFMLSTVLLPCNATLRNSYFISDDPFWAIKAQMAQHKAGLNALPLAASYSGPEAVSTGLNWQSFAPTPRFFHSAVLTPDVISQACTAKGYVCVLPSKNVEQSATPTRSMQRLAVIRRQAQTWQAALESALERTNETAAQSFVTKLTIELPRLQNFFQHRKHNLPPEFCARLLTQIEAAPGIPVKVYKKATIIERDGGWWTHTNHQVCNARPQIHKIVHSEQGERMYVGTIAINGQELEFADSAARIERIGLLAYAAQHAAAHGQLLLFDRHWNAKSHLAALRLHEPEIVHISGEAGWNEQANQFCFRRYAINNDGSVTPCPYPQIQATLPDFPEPIEVAPVTVHHLLTPAYESATLWTGFAAIVANLLAPVLGQTPTANGVVGNTFDAALAVGLGLDCGQYRCSSSQRQNASTSVITHLRDVRWPLFAFHAFDDLMLCRTVLRVPSGPLFARLSELTAHLAPGYGWQVIRGPAPDVRPDLSALRYILPTYIQRALTRRMHLATQRTNLTIAVLQDLAEWLKDIYGATFNVAYATNKLVTPDRAHEALMAAINLGITSGALDVLPRPRRKDQSSNYLLRQKTSWWLNQKAIDRYCISAGGVIPNWAAVTELLAHHGLLNDEQIVHGMPGLLVNRDWCDSFWSDYTADARELG